MPYVAFVYKLNEVLNLSWMRNGKLIGHTHCDATSADSMQFCMPV